MANDFEITTESLSTIAATLRSEGNNIGEALSTLETAVSQLQSQWDGAAREAYSAAQQVWSTRFADMKALLGAIADNTDGIAAAYEKADAAAAAAFGE